VRSVIACGSEQMLGRRAGAGGLGGVSLRVTQFGDSLGECGESGDQCHQGQRLAIAGSAGRS
jgi:hypothetical protein